MISDDRLRELWNAHGWKTTTPPYLFADAVEREARREERERCEYVVLKARELLEHADVDPPDYAQWLGKAIAWLDGGPEP